MYVLETSIGVPEVCMGCMCIIPFALFIILKLALHSVDHCLYILIPLIHTHEVLSHDVNGKCAIIKFRYQHCNESTVGD